MKDKIHGILKKPLEIVFQPKDSKLCGQACVAMILGIPLDEAIKLVGKAGATNTKDLTKVIGREGKLTRVSSRHRIPQTALLKVIWNDKRSHWVLIDNDTVYDPSFGRASLTDYTEIINGRITSFLPL